MSISCISLGGGNKMTIFGNDDIIDSQHKTRHIRLDYLIPSRQRRLWGSVPIPSISLFKILKGFTRALQN